LEAKSVGFWSWIGSLFAFPSPPPKTSTVPSPRNLLGVKQLCNRLGVSLEEIESALTGKYWWHRIPKRRGGTRLLYSPRPALKSLQRTILRKLLAKLPVHPAAKGFRRGESVVTHAKLHVGRKLVVRIDIRDFFSATRSARVYQYFHKIGWDYRATATLLRACCHRRGLPQGAPTSPALSNLVNYGMDARLAGLALHSGAIYSRYADDIIFSFNRDKHRFVKGVVRRIAKILRSYHYQIHGMPKLQYMRRHQRQSITGLVVNEKLQLPRKVRRWLRAVEHHHGTGRPGTLTPEQLAGWQAYRRMIERQR
jgi:retron-type reverse transcriptase